MPFIVQALVRTLPADDNVDLVQHLPEGELLAFQHHAAGFNPAHIQNIINQTEQVLGTGADFLQLVPGFGLEVRIMQRQGIQADNRVHRRPDFMAHIRKKTGFCLAGVLGQGFFNLCFPLPLLGVGIDVEQDHQGDDNQADLDENADAERGIHLVQRASEIIRHGTGCPGYQVHARVLQLADVIGLDRSGGPVDGGFRILAHPDGGGENNQAEQHHPGHTGAAEPLVFILFQDITENDKAKDAPGSQNQVGFR